MHAHPPPAEDICPLEAYPFQVTFATRFGDLALDGAIEHIGMARNYEDGRGALMEHLAGKAGVPRRRLHSFLARATNERWAAVRYPAKITIGSAVIAMGSSSYTIELAAFQDGVCVGRSHALAVTVGDDGAPAPLTQELREIWKRAYSERPGWHAPAKPAAERRRLAYYTHHLSWPTRFSDTDALGHLNNIAHLRYCDEGRAALVMAAGKDLTAGALGQVERVDVSYLHEARLPHPLTVASSVGAVEGEVAHLEQALFQGDVCVGVCDARVRVTPEMAGRLAAQERRSQGRYS